MGYNKQTVKFFIETEWWVSGKPISKMNTRAPSGLLNLPLWVNKEQWNILKAGGELEDAIPKDTHLYKVLMEQMEVCEVILLAKYDV